MNKINNKTEEIPKGLSFKELETQFQSLASELRDGSISIPNLMEQEKKKEPPFFRNYDPGINDFLARANTFEECKEIISYCLAKNEISIEYAEELRILLSKEGPKIFGTRKTGFYDNKLNS